MDREQPGDDPLRRHYLTQIAHFGQHVTYPTDYQRRLQQSRVSIIGAEYIGSMLVQHLAAAGIGHLRAVGPALWSGTEAPFVGQGKHRSGDLARHALLASRAQTLGFETTYEAIVADSATPLDWETMLTGCDLVAVVLPQSFPSLLRAVNQACLARHIPLLPVWIEATGAHIGPLVVPDDTPCLLCLALRQGEPLTLEAFRALHHTEPVALPAWEDSAMLIPWASAVAAMAACDIVAALTQYRQPTSYGQALFVAAQEWRLQVTPVLKIPRCPACSPLRHCPSPQPFALPAQEDTGDDA
jgi:bacteriocin biosynthesis cyclodehydratase domain-containing protein